MTQYFEIKPVVTGAKKGVETIRKIVEHVDALVGNEEDLQKGLGLQGQDVQSQSKLDPQSFFKMIDQVRASRRCLGLRGRGEGEDVGGGCAGFQYDLYFEDKPTDLDEQFESHGVKLFVDPISIQNLKNAEVDFVDTITGGGFTIKNPNAKSTCGCGSSFSTE